MSKKHSFRRWWVGWLLVPLLIFLVSTTAFVFNPWRCLTHRVALINPGPVRPTFVKLSLISQGEQEANERTLWQGKPSPDVVAEVWVRACTISRFRILAQFPGADKPIIKELGRIGPRFSDTTQIEIEVDEIVNHRVDFLRGGMWDFFDLLANDYRSIKAFFDWLWPW